jgi:aldose 1-epimerase
MKPYLEPLNLASGPWELEVLPDRGGAIAALRHAARAVLVSPNATTPDAMGFANFALLPYVNRIAHGRFRHLQQEWLLPRNFGDHIHPLHGTGWKRAWQVADVQPSAIELQLLHERDAHWPWSFRATQRITLAADHVRFDLCVENTAAVHAPMGVGFHPAFAASPATTMQAGVEGVWLTDDASLPQSWLRVGDFDASMSDVCQGGPVLRPILVDHCFTGWSRTLHITQAGYGGAIPTVIVTASDAMTFLQLYMPPGKDWFCAEPMTQMPDAINRNADQHATGLRILAPGKSLRVWMTIAVPGAWSAPDWWR